MQEIHGLSGLSQTVKDGADSAQEVVVRDRDGKVTIEIHHPHSYGARLSPEETEYLATILWSAAKRAKGEPTISASFDGTVEPMPAPVTDAPFSFPNKNVEEGGPNHQVPTGRPIGLNNIADATWNAGLASPPADAGVEIRSEGGPPPHRRFGDLKPTSTETVPDWLKPRETDPETPF